MNRPTSTGNRYLVQLPVAVGDLTAATRIARVVAWSPSFHNLIEYAETTVTMADQVDSRHPAFCPRRLLNGRRCLLEPDHDGLCARRLLR